MRAQVDRFLSGCRPETVQIDRIKRVIKFTGMFLGTFSGLPFAGIAYACGGGSWWLGSFFVVGTVASSGSLASWGQMHAWNAILNPHKADQLEGPVVVYTRRSLSVVCAALSMVPVLYMGYVFGGSLAWPFVSFAADYGTRAYAFHILFEKYFNLLRKKLFKLRATLRKDQTLLEQIRNIDENLILLSDIFGRITESIKAMDRSSAEEYVQQVSQTLSGLETISLDEFITHFKLITPKKLIDSDQLISKGSRADRFIFRAELFSELAPIASAMFNFHLSYKASKLIFDNMALNSIVAGFVVSPTFALESDVTMGVVKNVLQGSVHQLKYNRPSILWRSFFKQKLALFLSMTLILALSFAAIYYVITNEISEPFGSVIACFILAGSAIIVGNSFNTLSNEVLIYGALSRQGAQTDASLQQIVSALLNLERKIQALPYPLAESKVQSLIKGGIFKSFEQPSSSSWVIAKKSSEDPLLLAP